MSEGSAFLAAAAATVVLAVLHATVPTMRRRLSGVGEGVMAAVGGGVATAYVFLHLLPDLGRGNQEVAEALDDHVAVSALAESLLFSAAFLGFLLLYGLDHLAAARSGQAGSFAVHLAVFALYNGLITYALPTYFRVGPGFAILFVVAMGLHFVLTDRALAEHHGDRFRRFGRPTLVAALVAGFLLAWAFAPSSTIVVSVLLAALAGFILYNVFSDEIPDEREVRFPVFALSTGTYAVLLFALTFVEA